MTTSPDDPARSRHLHAVPDVGTGPHPARWHEVEMVAHEFLRKPRLLDFPYTVCHPLLTSALDFHVTHGGHPWRWNVDDVGLLLDRWLPTGDVAAPDSMKYLPDLLAGFIRFAHHDLPAVDTQPALDLIDWRRPEFLCSVGAYGWQTPASVHRYEAFDLPADPLVVSDGPLPDEPFAWTEVPGDLVPLFEDLIPLLDRFADDCLTVQFRTAIRRFVRLLACQDPRPLRRRGTVHQKAAAIAWAVLHVNDELGPGRKRLTAIALADWFGVLTPRDRGLSMLRAAGLGPRWNGPRPWTAEQAGVLVGEHRQRIVGR